MIDHVDEDRENIFMISQQKAYDRIDHRFLWSILKHVGAPEQMIEAIKSCYVGATSSGNINGHISKPVIIN